MKKEKTVRTYQRRTKTGKVVTVHQHTAKYDAAEAQREAAKKKGAGEELSAKKASKPQASATPDYGFTAEEYKSWYHWDTENDPKNKAALKVEKALKAKLGAKGYKKYFDDMTDGYSARGHNKAFGGLGGYFKGDTSTGKPAKTTKPAKESREDATKRFMASPTPQKGEEGYAVHKALRGALRQGCGDDGTRDLLVRYGYPKDKAYSKGIEEVVSLAKKHGIDISLHSGSKRKGSEKPKSSEGKPTKLPSTQKAPKEGSMDSYQGILNGAEVLNGAGKWVQPKFSVEKKTGDLVFKSQRAVLTRMYQNFRGEGWRSVKGMQILGNSSYTDGKVRVDIHAPVAGTQWVRVHRLKDGEKVD